MPEPIMASIGLYLTSGLCIPAFLASFSSAGPTVEGFVKPDMVAPGGHARGLMHTNTYLATTYPEFHDGAKYFMMSGTSQATAVVSGIAALLLQDEPWLTPDEVKGRLMSSARPASYSGGSLAYSVLQQGAGLVNAYDAVHSNTAHVANRGLDIDAEVNHIEPVALEQPHDDVLSYVMNVPLHRPYDDFADLLFPFLISLHGMAEEASILSDIPVFSDLIMGIILLILILHMA